MKEKIDVLKGRKVIIYARVSTEEQEGTLGDQVRTIITGLKALGYKGKPSVYQEQASGTKKDAKERPQLWEAMAEAQKSKKPAVIVVRDIQRFSRDPYHLGVLYQPLREREIPVMSIQEPIVLGTLKVPQPSSDLIAPIMISAGGSEVTTRKKQTLAGMAEAKVLGIIGGQPLDLQSKTSKLNPFREVQRLLNAGVGQSEGSRRIGRSGSFWRKTRDKMATMSDGQREEWFRVIDKIRAMEQEHGLGIGNRAPRKMMAVRRVASGFLKQPLQFPAPSNAELDYALKNYNEFKPKRGW
jgi:DNA invertase Pin-like site-specific DNA recombinase